MTNTTGNEPKTRGKGAVTLYLDKELWHAYQRLCEANPRAKSPSLEITKMIRAMIVKRGRAFGVRIPYQFAEK